MVKVQAVERPLDFLLVGAPRTGTTSLFRYLRKHPAVDMPMEKEAPFFSDERWLQLGWGAYVRHHFRRDHECNLGREHRSVRGKLTPQYWGDPNTFQRIAVMMPAIRLIVGLRNPVDRAFSHWRLASRRFSETREFEEATRDHPEYVPMGEYARILRELWKYFSAKQTYVYFVEELEEAPDYVLDQLLLHLGLPPGFRPRNLGERYNQSGMPRHPWVVPTLKKLAPVRWAWKLVPKHRRRIFHLWYEAEVNVRPAEVRSPPLPSGLRDSLVARFRPDVLALERMLGRRPPWPEFFTTEWPNNGSGTRRSD